MDEIKFGAGGVFALLSRREPSWRALRKPYTQRAHRFLGESSMIVWLGLQPNSGHRHVSIDIAAAQSLDPLCYSFRRV